MSSVSTSQWKLRKTGDRRIKSFVKAARREGERAKRADGGGGVEGTGGEVGGGAIEVFVAGESTDSVLSSPSTTMSVDVSSKGSSGVASTMMSPLSST